MTQTRNDNPGGPVADDVDVGRPLTARSVIASTLLGMDPPQLSGRLVRSGELFGIAEGTTRVALSRMVAAGELVADDGRYHLAGHLLHRFERQHASRWPAQRAWDGSWSAVVVVAERRPAADRAALRRSLVQLKLAERREGLWLRPANLDPERSPDAAAVVAGQARRFSAVPLDDDPAVLAAELWDLDGWSGRANGIVALLDEHRGELDEHGTAALAEGFVLAAAALRHLLADPLLPDALLPGGWSGARLRAAYERYDAAFTGVWRRWYRGQR